jgi:WD40 repeat protein
MMNLLTLMLLSQLKPEPLIEGSPYVLRGHRDGISGIAYFPDGKSIASVGRDKQLLVTDVSTGKQLLTLQFSEGQALNAVAVSDDGKFVAVGDVAFQVRVIDVAKKAQRMAFMFPDVVAGLDFSPDSKLLAVASVGENGQVYDLATQKSVAEFRGHTAKFLSDSNTLVISHRSNGIALINLAESKKTTKMPMGLTDPWVSVNRKSPILLSFVPGTDSATIFDLQTQKIKSALVRRPKNSNGNDPTILTAATSETEPYAALAFSDGVVRLWNWETNRADVLFPGKSTSVAFSPNGRSIAASVLAEIRIWKVPSVSPAAVPIK